MSPCRAHQTLRLAGSHCVQIVTFSFCNYLVHYSSGFTAGLWDCPGPCVAFLRTTGLFDQNWPESNSITTIKYRRNTWKHCGLSLLYFWQPEIGWRCFLFLTTIKHFFYFHKKNPLNIHLLGSTCWTLKWYNNTWYPFVPLKFHLLGSI